MLGLIPYISYTPHDFSKPDKDSKFSVAITDDFSLDSTILNTDGPDGGLFLDSTHRLHNQNRAPTTVLCTANSEKHMMPGKRAYLISANIQAETLKGWLLETITKIEARAREIVEDKSKIKHRTRADREKIFARCQEIVKNGFKFSHLMMDKSGSELNAVLEELGMDDVYIRLCQFHVIQAILRWDSDHGLQGIGFSLSDDLKFGICELFRSLQRCRTWETWPEAKHIFYLGLNAAKASGLTCFEAVKAYFDKNWFINRWIPYFTDIGMPLDQSRDGTWNTNNWAETAFKQFNSVFLDNKHNKRIDRLALVILTQHLPYFKYFPTPSRPEARDYVDLNLDAYALWESDLVHTSPTPTNSDTFKVDRMRWAMDFSRFLVALTHIK
ncbi:hypothetical protein DFH09DRAFT_945637 [Mycena vulgaris]|nr:hypothetical protein DFH09DRAFT_945637 [Mycena vulgaris]